ncbi:MAG TPA: DUF3343 domain-containing protein [Longimicrobiales bacterium]|nr:DUF3343 domain-containing protein [Longimicrobiales bacterium]
MKLLVFDTTHHALWAEEIARDKGLGVDVVPAPADADAKCDLALAFLEEDELELIASLDAAGVPFRLHVR